MHQQMGRKGVEGEAIAADSDRTHGEGEEAKGYCLPVMRMAPLPYCKDDIREEHHSFRTSLNTHT